MSNAKGNPSVVIIGAGMSGICMAIQLKKTGVTDIRIVERSTRVGGTWNDNSYPGAACDVPSHLYSFSFERNPDWSRTFSPQPEIQAYFERVAEKYGLYDLITFGREVEQADFDEASSQWKVTLDNGEVWTSDILIGGTGQLNKPNIPAIEGADDFAGVSFHSARWNHDRDLTGRKVAVIGNAASAVQFIPEIAKQVGHLSVFQRSANWIVPRNDKHYSNFTKWMFRNVPGIEWLNRQKIYWRLELSYQNFTNKDSWLKRAAKKAALQHMEDQVPDEALRKKLTPDYPMGCKRVLITDDYYPALMRENVDLVTDGIERIEANGVRDKNGVLHEADTIIYATGFNASDYLTPMEIHGVGGKSLNDSWREGAEAYKGVAVSGFPNFFLLYGPNTNLGHNSIIFMVEQQVGYVIQCIEEIRAKNLARLDVKAEAQQAFNKQMQEDMKQTVWVSGCTSWYVNEYGKVTQNWPLSTVQFRKRMAHPDFTAYEEVVRV